MKRVLLDQGLAPGAATTLRNAGWHAAHVSELGLDRAEDAAIIDYARDHGMACITLDHDFHAHLAMASAGSPSVVLVRAEGLSALQQAALIQTVWELCGARSLPRARLFPPMVRRSGGVGCRCAES